MKIRTAFELPLTHVQALNHDNSIVDRNGAVIVPVVGVNMKTGDARYIAHACNAYPKLIAALKTARELLDERYAAVEINVKEAGKLSALLRELGEGR